MTTQKLELMPDKIFYDGADAWSFARHGNCFSYTRTDIYTAAIAERYYWVQKYNEEANQNVAIKKEQDALRKLCEGMAAVLKEAEKHLVAAQWNARDASIKDQRWEGVSEVIQPCVDATRSTLAAYEKHKKGE